MTIEVELLPKTFCVIHGMWRGCCMWRIAMIEGWMEAMITLISGTGDPDTDCCAKNETLFEYFVFRFYSNKWLGCFT